MEPLATFYRTINEKTVQHRSYIIALAGSAVLVAVLAPLFLSSVELGRAENPPRTDSVGVATKKTFEAVSLTARAAYVLDLANHEVLFKKNETEILPLASVTKLMTALVAHESVDPGAVFSVAKEDLSVEGDIGLRPGERFKVGDLLDAMLLVSSNDAAHAISRVVESSIDPTTPSPRDVYARFVERMNTQAKSFGLTSLTFLNESGLDVERDGTIVAGGLGSAHDVALLAERLWREYPTALSATTKPALRITSYDNHTHVLLNTNEALGRYPGMLGSKTGYTDLAGGNLVIVFDVGINHPVAAVVLGSTRDGRFEDMARLTQATLKYFE